MNKNNLEDNFGSSSLSELKKVETIKSKRKNTLSGFKFKFLGRTPSGVFLSEEDAVKRCATIVYQAFFLRGLVVKAVFFKPKALDFFVATEKELVSLNSLDKNWVNEFKYNWGRVFFNAAIGVYTLYEDQYEDITNVVNELVLAYNDKCAKPEDLWFKKEREDYIKRMKREN